MADLEIRDIPYRLKEGITFAERGYLERAFPIFSGYLEAYPDSALALSYTGMIRTVKDGEVQQGLQMCQEAVQRDPKEALVHLNLSRVHFHMGDRFQAVRALQKGLKIRSPYRECLMGFQVTMGRRRNPPISFLPRNNPINELLGKITWKLKGGRH